MLHIHFWLLPLLFPWSYLYQLTAFIAFIVLSPIFIFVLATLKGHYLKAWIFLILGGLAAFFIYYLQGILPYIDILIGHVFFQIKTNVYQIPSVSANALLMNFGFILAFAVPGLFLAYIKLKSKIVAFLLLLMSLLIPLILSQSYIIGLYLPYHMFVYYLMPPLVILVQYLYFSLLSTHAILLTHLVR